MASFGHQFSSSPVLTMPPQSAHQPNVAPSGPFGQTNTPFGGSNSAAASNSNSAMSNPFQPAASQTARPQAAGRKRSRDEAGPNLNEEGPSADAIRAATKPNEEGWVYGEGMVLIKPEEAYTPDASTQSGTWLEQKKSSEQNTRQMAIEEALAQQSQSRPTLRNTKSQRLEQSVVPSPGAEVAAFNLGMGAPSPSAMGQQAASSPAADTNGMPVVDDFTLHLGIGWRKISDDEDIQAAARGWARYIENHYPVSNATIRLESRGLQAYLVEAAEGFYLFSEDLKEGRLVSTTVEQTLQHLKNSPPTFEGQQSLAAAESPSPYDESNAPDFPLGTQQQQPAGMEVEMS